MHNYSSLDTSGQWLDEFIIFLHLAEPVVGPEVFEVLVYLAIETVREGFIFSEPRKQSHPVVKFECLLFHAQVLIERADDFDKRAHYEGEESHTRQHDADSNNFLKVGYRK